MARREFLKMAAAGTLSIIAGVGCENKERDEYKGPKIEFHVHPFLKKYGLDDVIDKAIEKNIKVLGLEAYNNDIFPLLLQESKKSKHKIDADSITISVDDGKLYLPRATEVMTKQGFHLLLIGDYKIKPCEDADIEKGIEKKFCKNSDMYETIEKGLENDAIVILDHPFVNASTCWQDIGKEKEVELENVCKKYGDNIFLEWNAYMIPYLRAPILKLQNTNIKVLNLARRLKEYNIRVVADTDLHVRSKKWLEEMATAYVKTDVNAGSGKELVSSLRNKIKNKEYENYNKNYVSIPCIYSTFIAPFVLSKISQRLAERPRG